MVDIVNFLGKLGQAGDVLSSMQQQNQLGRLQYENPELYNTALQGQIANQQRQAQLEQRRRMREALANPEVLGSLSQQLNLPPELIQATGSLEELQGLANATSPRGGATGEIVRQIMRDNPEMGFTEALQLYQTGFRQGTRYDPETGSLVPIAGAPEALGAIKRGESYGAGIGGLEADLALRPQVEAATATAETGARLGAERQAGKEKRASDASNILDVVKQAEEILPKVSSGRLQAAVTEAGRFFGKSTEASQADRQMNILAATLVGNVPRFEGPQSNIDVQFYKDAAGDVANPDLPREDRLAALQIIKGLQQKYKDAVYEPVQPAGEMEDFTKLSEEELEAIINGL